MSLDAEPFDSRRVSGDRLFIAYEGRHVVTLAGVQARKFLQRAEGLRGEALQLLMAKATKNFKRGNERASR